MTRRWPFGAALAMQIALVTAMVLVSMLTIPPIAPPDFRIPVAAPSAPRPVSVQVVSVQRRGAAGIVAPGPQRVFTAPSRIPAQVAMIDDGPASAVVDLPFGPVATSGAGPVAFPFSQPVAASPRPEQRKPEPVRQKEPLRIGGRVLEAQILNRVIPVYPILAKAARIGGTVRLIGIIGKNGTVQNLQVISGHPLLVNAALDAVRQWLYVPTMLNGEPVEVIAPIDVNFTLTQ